MPSKAFANYFNELGFVAMTEQILTEQFDQKMLWQLPVENDMVPAG